MQRTWEGLTSLPHASKPLASKEEKRNDCLLRRRLRGEYGSKGSDALASQLLQSSQRKT